MSSILSPFLVYRFFDGPGKGALRESFPVFSFFGSSYILESSKNRAFLRELLVFLGELFVPTNRPDKKLLVNGLQVRPQTKIEGVPTFSSFTKDPHSSWNRILKILFSIE
ncbi:hypothetical protein [Leptospira adleri]|uniref:hypothetical protein n=1 Tax=Leptospira adleri TaxID=2023186 RepID=UPI0010829FF3|nr:hypothetical protein [Leptospira adleri]TGM52885.1 hypothetical protein EHQ97_13280 [Leptospira adleri]